MPKEPEETSLVSATPAISLADGAVMHAPIEQFTTGGAAQTYLLLGLMEKAIEARKKVVRDRLLADAKDLGEPTETGSQKLDVEGSTVTRERREQHKLEEDKVLALLEKKGIAKDKGFDKVTTWVASLSKLQALVENGALTKEDLDGLFDVTWAIKVKASADFAKILEEVKQVISGPQLPAGK